jgi:DNA-binding NarL/FixJ family response regulator
MLIDDHPIVLEGMRMLLQTRMAQVRVHTAASLPEALQSGVQPDVVGLDIKLPGINGLDGLVLIKRHWPQTKVFMLSSQDDDQTRAQALAQGALAFVSKGTGSDHIVQTIEALLHHGSAHPPSASAGDVTPPGLTPRQSEVLGLLHSGKSNKFIARQLDISENTVRRHIQHIFSFLGVNSRTEAAFEARRRGLVS